jgi:hypothetical protein
MSFELNMVMSEVFDAGIMIMGVLETLFEVGGLFTTAC